MKKMMVSLTALMLVFIITACSGSNNNASNANSGAGNQEEKVTLKVWTIWPSGDFKPVLDELVTNWNTENPNVQIVVEATENEAYKTKVKTAAAANELPDIFYTWGAGFSKPFVDGDKVLALDDYLNDGTKDKLVADSLDNFTYNGSVYGLPYTMWLGTMFVNEELFEQNNLSIPTTFDELIAVSKSFRKLGIDPIAVGGKDLWPSMFYHNILSVREGGAQLNNDALINAASFEDEAFTRSAAKLQELANADAFMKGYMGLSRDESEAVFLAGQVPMYFNGSWFAKTLDSAPEVKENVVAVKFPIVEGGAGNENEWIGGMLDTFMVSSATQYPEQSVEFLKYMTENLSSGGYKTGAGLPTWTTAEFDDSEIDPLLKDIADLYLEGTGLVPVYDLFLEGQQAEAHKNLVAELLAGKITPEEFGTKMQALER